MALGMCGCNVLFILLLLLLLLLLFQVVSVLFQSNRLLILFVKIFSYSLDGSTVQRRVNVAVGGVVVKVTQLKVT